MTFESTRRAAEKSFMRTAIGHVVFFKRALLPIHLFEEIKVFQACASSRYQLRKLECFKHALMEIRVFQAYACGRCCDTETSRSLSLLRTCACAQVRLLPFFPVLPHCGGMSLCALSACTHVDVVTPSWLKSDEKHHPLSSLPNDSRHPTKKPPRDPPGSTGLFWLSPSDAAVDCPEHVTTSSAHDSEDSRNLGQRNRFRSPRCAFPDLVALLHVWSSTSDRLAAEKKTSPATQSGVVRTAASHRGL